MYGVKFHHTLTLNGLEQQLGHDTLVYVPCVSAIRFCPHLDIHVTMSKMSPGTNVTMYFVFIILLKSPTNTFAFLLFTCAGVTTGIHCTCNT